MAKNKASRKYSREQCQSPDQMTESFDPGLSLQPQVQPEVHGHSKMRLHFPWTKNPFDILDPDLSECELKKLCISGTKRPVVSRIESFEWEMKQGHDTGIGLCASCPQLVHKKKGKRVLTTTRSLLDLPLELRLRIYSMLIVDCPQTGSDNPGFYVWNIEELERRGSIYQFAALIRTCRQIHLELGPEVYKRVALNRFQGAAGAIQWLERIGSNTRHIRRVDISYHSKDRSVYSNDIEYQEEMAKDHTSPYKDLYGFLEKKCPNLQSIHVKLRRYEFHADWWLPRSGFWDSLGEERLFRYLHNPRRMMRPALYRLREDPTRRHLRRLREASLMLQGLARFHWIKDITIFHHGGFGGLDQLASPAMAFFLRGSLGFHLKYSFETVAGNFNGRGFGNLRAPSRFYATQFEGYVIRLTNPFWELPSELGGLREHVQLVDGLVEGTVTGGLVTRAACENEMHEREARGIIRLRNSQLAQHQHRAEIILRPKEPSGRHEYIPGKYSSRQKT